LVILMFFFVAQVVSMANRAYLALNFSGAPNDQPRAQTIVAAASYCYPILWWSIFGPTNIAARTEGWEDDDGNPIPVEVPTLITIPSAARQRACGRQDVFYTYFPATAAPIYQQWQSLLAQLDAPFVQLFTDEICMMSDPDPTKTNVDRYERAFQAASAYVRAFEEGRVDDWMKLLRQVQIDLDPQTGRLTYLEWENGASRTLTPPEIEAELGYRLRGYGWERPVPWPDD
jgi:hypothetical protein